MFPPQSDCPCGVIFVGTYLLVVVLSPIWPLPFSPHIYNVSASPFELVSTVTALWFIPKDKSIMFPSQLDCPCGVIIVGVSLFDVVPSPIWPKLLYPHIYNVSA
ncbi:hypothetical protein HEPPS_05830 [Candidatus Hepatoplasma crinochetorum]|uniref:Uncharacterized protein n=1 Tax=Candidatus Hepatoplasma crinochetorum TaxID=295596 RepID=A0A0G7ZMC9_9MOLU|nr:hypothetical protein HEPPS_05830 [Candidatus Hepatoplasma crinochetorum]